MKLIPFPGTAAKCRFSVEADLTWRGSLFCIDFRVQNHHEIQGLVEGSRIGERTDRLWEKTCLEVFLRPVEHESYWEINLAPDGCWNLWRLQGYRAGLVAEERILGPESWTSKFDGDVWTLSVVFDMKSVPEMSARPVRIAVAAVAEHKAGEKTYWSLIHSQEKPDFHYPDHFVLLYENGGWA